jgi:hypothetical protein
MATLKITYTDDSLDTTHISVTIKEPGAIEYVQAMSGFLQLLTYHPVTVAMALQSVAEDLVPEQEQANDQLLKDFESLEMWEAEPIFPRESEDNSNAV